MMITPHQLKLIHVAKRKVHLPDDAYRSALAQIAGVTSSEDLDREGFEAMMGLFPYLGFEPVKAQGRNYGARPGMASFAQLELIRALWQEETSWQARRGRVQHIARALFQGFLAALPDGRGRTQGRSRH